LFGGAGRRDRLAKIAVELIRLGDRVEFVLPARRPVAPHRVESGGVRGAQLLRAGDLLEARARLFPRREVFHRVRRPLQPAIARRDRAGRRASDRRHRVQRVLGRVDPLLKAIDRHPRTGHRTRELVDHLQD